MDFNLSMALSTVPSTEQVLNKKLIVTQGGLGKMSLDMQKHT